MVGKMNLPEAKDGIDYQKLLDTWGERVFSRIR